MKKQLAGITLILITGSLLCSAQKTPGEKGSDEREEKLKERTLKQFDKDNDGTLSESEKATAKAALAERKAKMDTNGDGKVSATERKAARKQMMKRLDTDGDGKISEAERKAAGDKRKSRPTADN